MKRSHAGFWAGIAVFFLAAVYSIILFLVKQRLEPTEWVLYGATMVAFLLMGVQSAAVSHSGSGIALDTALCILTAIYFALQLIFGGIVFMSMQDVPLIPAIVGELVLLAAYLVIAFLMYAAQSSSAAQDYNDRKAVQKMLLLENDVQGMAEGATNPDVKKALEELVEAIHYSDAVALPELADVDRRIAKNVAMLQDELTEEDAKPLVRIEKIRRLLRERERMAVVLKR